ncbi:universal stress protein [Nigerium massiliense]|uniref:universal stress protein n=1 Tax=Nigerium massiliense TaxID=1522317 RepID=UPI00058AF251|nr:universal stress protein [Nigerium massiliense]
MKILIWVQEATWPACIDAVRSRPAGDSITLVHARDSHEEVPRGLMDGLMGRGYGRRPADRLAAVSDEAAQDVLERAASRLGRPCERLSLTGRPERLITEQAATADLLVLARDGDRSRLGPQSLGKHTRFVVDHAPCPVLLLWPESSPSLESIPPPPPPGHEPPEPRP